MGSLGDDVVVTCHRLQYQWMIFGTDVTRMVYSDHALRSCSHSEQGY